MNRLNFLTEVVAENWIDYFVNRARFRLLLDTVETNANVGVQFINQFVEQAHLAEKELENLQHKEFDDDDALYCRQKTLRLWLCAFCLVAATNWDLDLLNAECSVLVINKIFNRLVAFCLPNKKIAYNECVPSVIWRTHKDLPMSAKIPGLIFISWLYAKWIMQICAEGRFREKVARPTVSNPANQYDSNLFLAEQVRTRLMELRSQCPEAVSFAEGILNAEPSPIFNIFSTDYFFAELNRANEPATVDVDDDRFQIFCSPNLEVLCYDIDEKVWKLSTRYMLMCNDFAFGQVKKCVKQLETIVKDVLVFSDRLAHAGEFPKLLHINSNELQGYCTALRVATDQFEVPSVRKNINRGVIGDEEIKELISNPSSDTLIKRRQCYCIASTSSATRLSELSVENIIQELSRDVLDIASLHAISNNEINYLIQELKHEKDGSKRCSAISAVLYSLCLKYRGLRLELSSIDALSNRLSFCRDAECVLNNIEAADKVKLNGLLSGGPDFWRFLLSYDVAELRSIFARSNGKLVIPARFYVSKMVGEISSALTAPNNDYISILLAKLEQLSNIRDVNQWNSFCNDCVKELGSMGKNPEVQLRFAYDAVRVQLCCWHSRFMQNVSTTQFLRVTQDLQQTVKGLIQASISMSSNLGSLLGKLLLEIVSFLINTGEWETIVKSPLKVKNSFHDVSKVLAAYMMGDTTISKRIADGPWWQIMYPTFGDVSHKRKSDGNLTREQSKQLISRSQFFDLLRLIKENRSISFLISFLGRLHNAAQEPLFINGCDLTVFVEHTEYWQAINEDILFDQFYISECMKIVFKNAMLVNPINAFWLRSFADFRFVQQQYSDALVLYMEACVACSESFTRSLPDNVVDDMLWRKVQYCLRESNMHTLAACITQLMKSPHEHYVSTAKALLDSCGDTNDASTGYFNVINDINLIEFMNDAYHKLGLHRTAESLLESLSVPEMNYHSAQHNERSRRCQRLLHILSAHVFSIHV